MKYPVTIQKMAFGGAGFGRGVDGKACFVPYTAPGDEAVIRIVKEKRSYLEGELLDLARASSARVTPSCPHFTICGGCNWLHLDYQVQLQEKQHIFSDLLSHQGVEREAILPIVPSEAEFGYRSRVQFKLHFAGGRLHIGFYRASSHYVVDLPEGCPLADPGINNILGQLRELLKGFPEKNHIPQIDVTAGDDGTAIVIVHYIGSSPEDAASCLSGWQDHLLAAGLYLQTGRKNSLRKIFGVEKVSYSLSGDFRPDSRTLKLSFSRGGFSQVNYRQNQALIRLALQWLDLTGSEKILDLFCGNGNFSLPLAQHAAEVMGLEIFDASIDDARYNCRTNGIENARFVCGNAAKELKRLETAGEIFDIVLLDPPRSGASDIVAGLPALQPRAILYVSCDPATLARDLGILKPHGYSVVKSCPVDMFPQTYHIESVTLLHRR